MKAKALMFLRASFFDMMLQVGGVTEDTTINHPTTTTTNVTTIIAPQKTTMYPRCETELMFWVLVLDPLETDCGSVPSGDTADLQTDTAEWVCVTAASLLQDECRRRFVSPREGVRLEEIIAAVVSSQSIKAPSV